MGGYSHLRSKHEKKFHEFSFAAHNLDPNNPEAVSCYSRSFNLKKDINQRIRYAKQARELNPSHAGSNYDYGMALCNEKRFDEAEEHIERAIKLDPIKSRNYRGFFRYFIWALATPRRQCFGLK